MTFHSRNYIATLLLSAILAGCSNSQNTDNNNNIPHSNIESDSGHVADHGQSDEIVFPLEKAKAAGVEIATVSPTNFSQIIPVTGKIISNPGDEATVSATRQGIVKMPKGWSAGLQVSAGTPLFHISSAGNSEGDPAAMAKIAYQKAKQDFERAENLYREKLITAEEYQTAKSNLESAKLAYDSYGGGASSATITAPKSGYVLECYVKDGDFVDVGTPLMTITQNRKMRLQADLPLKDAHKLSQITSANFILSDPDRVYKLSELNGHIVSRGQTSGSNSSFLPLVFEFDNAPALQPDPLPKFTSSAHRKKMR